MDLFKAKVERDGQVVAASVEGRLTVDLKADGSQVWSGYFNVPAGTPAAVNDVLDLTLDNGKSKKVKVDRVNSLSHGTTVSFNSQML